VNYADTFIAVADDCPAKAAVVPQHRAGKATVAVIHYELLAGCAYQLTQEDVLWRTHVRVKAIAARELTASGPALRAAFFAKDQPCLRTSPLARKLGWGFHFDPTGKVALYAVESDAYQRLSERAARMVKALRSSRA
jgi:hypothetical protein